MANEQPPAQGHAKAMSGIGHGLLPEPARLADGLEVGNPRHNDVWFAPWRVYSRRWVPRGLATLGCTTRIAPGEAGLGKALTHHVRPNAAFRCLLSTSPVGERGAFVSRQVVIALALSALALGAGVAGQQTSITGGIAGPQVAQVAQVGPRDPGQPSMRQIPIGTGALTGTVVAADTGRPLARAQVSVNGSVALATPMPTRLGAPSSSNQAMVTGLPLSRTAVTNAEGRFSFEAMPAGQFTIAVQRSQYLLTNYGQTRPNRPGTAIRLAEGQRREISVPMLRGGVISGTVYGEDGWPLTNAQVRAMRLTIASGIRRMQTMSSANTDDRGVYRMFGLQPGEYTVAAQPNQSESMMPAQAEAQSAAFEAALVASIAQRSGSGPRPSFVAVPMATGGPQIQPAGYAPTYHPSSPSIGGASRFTIGAGEERLNVDVNVLPVRASHIKGTVAGIPGPHVAVQVSLLNEDPAADLTSLASARTGPDGSFNLQNVPPGRYTLVAQTVIAPNPQVVGSAAAAARTLPPTLDAELRLWGRASVTVDGQVLPLLAIVLQPGRIISGSVVSEMTRPLDLTRGALTVMVSPAPSAQQTPMFGAMPQALVGVDGRFELAGVPPGSYMFRAAGGGMVKAAVANGEDTLDFPLVVTGDRDVSGVVITLTDRSSELTGTLTGASGEGTAAYTIVIASSERRFWTPASRRVQTVRPGLDGRYVLRGLPSGDYLLAAVTDLEPGSQWDPEFLSELAGAAVHVSIADGGRHTQDIRVAQ